MRRELGASPLLAKSKAAAEARNLGLQFVGLDGGEDHVEGLCQPLMTLHVLYHTRVIPAEAEREG